MWDLLLFVWWTPGWLLFHAGDITVCENTTAIRIFAQSYKVTAEHLLCSLKCIMAMSSAEAFKLKVIIKLVRGRDEKWMTALGFHSELMTQCLLSPLLAELTVSGLSPAFCNHRSQRVIVSRRWEAGGCVLLQWALILYLIAVEMEQSPEGFSAHVSGDCGDEPGYILCSLSVSFHLLSYIFTFSSCTIHLIYILYVFIILLHCLPFSCTAAIQLNVSFQH